MSTDHPSKSRKDDSNPSMFENLKDQAGAQAHRLAEDVKDEAARHERDVRSNMSRQVDDFATALRSAKSDIDSGSVAGGIVDYAADNISGIADSLNRTSTGEMVDNIRDFARERPGTFLGLSALAGFAVTRFLLAGAHGQAGKPPPGTGDHQTSTPGAAGDDAGPRHGDTAGGGHG